MSNPYTTCQVCQGRGTVWVDNPDGSPAGEQTCPVCSGRGGTAFVLERVNAWFDHWAKWRKLFWWSMVALLIFDRLAPGLVNGDTGRLHTPLLLVWMFLVPAWFVMWVKRQPKHRSDGSLSRPERGGQPRQPKHAPGFTTDRERAGLGIFAGVVAARSAWDSYKKKF